MSIHSEIERIKGNIARTYSAVSDMGGVLPGRQTSANLEAAVRSIPSGAAAPLTPVEVYRATRPADWLPVPEPQDNEMYLLFHIPDGASSLLAFTVTCTGSYTVALGTVSDGRFVQRSAVPVATGATYEAELFAADYGSLTSDGFKQVMVKVSGTDIRTWEPSAHRKKAVPANFSDWNIVEIACKLPSGTKVACGSYRPTMALRKLRYFAWHGGNALSSAQYMFYYCYSLVTVLHLDISKATTMYGMFAQCTSLAVLPKLDSGNAANMYGLFQYCRSLKKVPDLNTSKAAATNYLFADCISLTEIPALDYSSSTAAASMFANASSLLKLSKLNLTKAADAANMFVNCNSLCSLTFDPDAAGWAGIDISLANCSFGHQALVDLFNSLPAITAAHTLDLTGNPGVSELTGEEKAIAAGKGWTLTL